MKLEDQLTSFDISKKLIELGLKQDSNFYWVKTGLNVITCEESWRLELLVHNLENIPNYYVSAFTVAELGEMLPYGYITIKHNGEKSPDKKDFYYCYMEELGYSDEAQSAYTEADARAKMLIYLIENKLIEV